ncbi:MAG TPA: acyl-CoA dehydrogenase family protein [Jatrophihabitantaceae bacterium]|nr:acyl-CoA dehydrogenase family protein [Jatrophihabitantaceae bacterium]
MYDGLEFAADGWLDEFRPAIAELATSARDELSRYTRAGEFPADIYREMGRRGWVGPFAAREEGGLGGGVAEYCVIEEEVGRHGLVPPQISIQGQRWLIDWGTAEQKERYLGPMARGELIFSESISEPGVGSSLKLMRSTLRRDGGDWVLNGTKTHVNLGHQSDVTLVFAVAEEGLTSILVDMNLPGVSSKQTDPIGLRLIPTADMYFDNVRVPDSALLGAPGRGMDTFLTTFNVSRLGNASELLGFGRRALAHATRYAEARQVGDNVVTDFQGIKWTVADRYAELYAAALARNNAARLLDRGDEPALATSLAKKLCIDAAEHAVNDAFALIGGHGLYTDTDFGQLMHDVKVLRIAGGSVEVLRNYIARRVLRSETLEGLE